MKTSPKNKILRIYALAVAMLLFSVVSGILLGAGGVSVIDLLSSAVRGDTESTALRILLYVRLPRVLAALICGMALAASGAVIQGVLANKLASPSIIGVNSGAGAAVVICSALGTVSAWQVSLCSFLGAFISVMLVSAGAKKWGASRGSVILMGVALNSILGAISDTIATFVPDVSMQSLDFKVGDFSSATYSRVVPAAVIILISVMILLSLSNELDVLTLGDENAMGLGLKVSTSRVLFLMLAALLAGAAVSICGLLSFVGLLVPHTVRRIASSEAKHLIPLSALFGAGFVTLCDTVSRVIFAPYELPVGIIMAFIGAPFFIIILLRKGGGHIDD